MLCPLPCRCCALVAAGLLSLGGLRAADSPAKPDPARGEVATLLFTGDIMLDDLPGEAVAKGIDPFGHLAEVLHSVDVTIGNLECVVSTKGKPIEDKPWTFQPHPRVLPVLARHFQVVSLANNHTGDFGHEAFLEQLELLDKHRIAHFGGGRNCVEARTPHIVQVKGLRIALLGYNDFHPREFEAGPAWPGVAWAVDEQVLADIEAARTIHKANLVIPFMHWGEEEVPENDRQRELARKMIDAGADLVVGAHPHVPQAMEYYQGKLIAYSLGNFVFDGYEESPMRTGWILRLQIDRKGVIRWDTVVIHLDDQGLPHPVKDAVSPAGNAREGTIEKRKGLSDGVFAPAGAR